MPGRADVLGALIEGVALREAEEWDTSLHPRDQLGRFTDRLRGLGVGEKVSVPGGVTVERVRAGFRMTGGVGPDGKDAAPGTTQNARGAAQFAVARSVRSTDPKSLGGATKHENAEVWVKRAGKPPAQPPKGTAPARTTEAEMERTEKPRKFEHELPDGHVDSRSSKAPYSHVVSTEGHVNDLSREDALAKAKAQPHAADYYGRMAEMAGKRRVLSWHSSMPHAAKAAETARSRGYRGVKLEAIKPPGGKSLADVTRADTVPMEKAKVGDFVMSGSGRSARIFQVTRIDSIEGKQIVAGRRVLKSSGKLSSNSYRIGALSESAYEDMVRSAGHVSSIVAREQQQRASMPSAASFNAKHPRGAKGSGSGGKFIAKGSSGAGVSTVQRRLGRKATGTFGPDLHAAVEAFQRAHGLQVDGVVGAQTAQALLGNRNAKAVTPGSLSAADAKALGVTTTSSKSSKSAGLKNAQPRPTAPTRVGGGVVV